MADKNTVLIVENLSKKFCRNLKRSMVYGMIDLFRAILPIPHPMDYLRKNEFWALRNINFQVCRGESVALIGGNGSGKTTLLRVISGIYPPDLGRVRVFGAVGPLSLGLGFHPHMNGYENIFLNGIILGMTSKEVRGKLEEIIDFADLPEESIRASLSTYSSGMRVRLAFAIAIILNPRILIMDEIIAVGDTSFRIKIMNRVRKYLEEGGSLLFVSHEADSCKTFCKRGIWIDKGLMMDDSIDNVASAYERSQRESVK